MVACGLWRRWQRQSYYNSLDEPVSVEQDESWSICGDLGGATRAKTAEHRPGSLQTAVQERPQAVQRQTLSVTSWSSSTRPPGQSRSYCAVSGWNGGRLDMAGADVHSSNMRASGNRMPLFRVVATRMQPFSLSPDTSAQPAPRGELSGIGGTGHSTAHYPRRW
jgi:hypothetical protein